MVERLFWHIGQPKTGTTYLQQILWSNEAALAEQGIALPGGKHRWLLWAALDLAQAPGLERRDKRAPGSWQRLVEEIRATTAPTAVISHEFFCWANADQVQAALAQLEGIEVHLVITARDAAGMLAAGWQEFVKNGSTASLRQMASVEEVSEFGWWTWDLAGVLERWSSTFAPERVHILPVPAKDAPRDQHWQSFAELIGCTHDVVLPRRQVNASLGVVQIEALRQINEHLRFNAANRGEWIRGYLAERRLAKQHSERVRLDDDLLQDCRARSERAVEIIQRRGLDLVGDISGLLVPDAAPQGRLESSVQPEERATALSELAARMLKDRVRVDRELQELKREHHKMARKLDQVQAELDVYEAEDQAATARAQRSLRSKLARRLKRS